MPFTPATHQRWWTDHWKERQQDLTAWLEESDPTSRQAVFTFVQGAGYGSVLEIGPGLLIDYRLHWKAHPFLRYEVVDVTPQVVALAEAEGITAHHGPAEALPLADKSFDFVYCRHVWEHCPDFSKPMQEMFRVAKYGAAVVLFRHKESGLDEINYGTYDGLETVYHNTYARGNITGFAKMLGWDTEWKLTKENAVAFFAPSP